MVDGAIIRAIKALEYANENLSEIDGEDEITKKALKVLKAFRDCVPKGLKKANSLDVMDEKGNLKFLEKYNKYAGFVINEAAKHLQESVECQNTKSN